MNIIPAIDLTQKFDEARNQGNRPTCLAFAMSDLNQFYSTSDVQSAEYLYRGAAHITPDWRPGDGTYLHKAIEVTASTGLPHESQYPYQDTEPDLPLEGLPVFPQTALFQNTFIDQNTATTQTVLDSLSKGRPIGLVILLTQTFYKPAGEIIEFSPLVVPNSHHAVLATAFGTDNVRGEIHVRVRNSWGKSWGDDGYGWLPVEYLNQHALQVFGATNG